MSPGALIYLHPAWQAAFTLLGLYAAWLGLKRLARAHLGRRTAFPRGRHILLGKLALGGVVLGALGGAVMARWLWRNWLVTGAHAWLGAAVVILALFGLAAGLVLERNPGKSKALPLAHGLANLAVMALCLVQFYAGGQLLDALGG